MRWLVLALLLALPGAGGQATQSEACRPPVLALQQPPDAFAPGRSMSLLMAIENPNGPPVDTVRATVTTSAPAGWAAIPAQRELTLGPMNVSITALAVTAPNRGSGAVGGNVTVLVTFVCSDEDIQTSASVSDVLTVSLRAFEAPWPVVLGAFLVLAGGVGMLGVRRLRRGVALVPLGDERGVAPGKNVKFTFVVENRRGKPQRLRLASSGVPAGWALHLALEEIDLEPGEEKTLWAIVKAPPHAPPGDVVDVALRLTDVSDGKEAASATLHAKVESA